MTPEIIKIYGERNCGTNYLEELSRRNLDVNLLPGSAPRRLRRLFPKQPSLHERVLDAYFNMTFKRNLGWKHMLAPDVATLHRTSVPIAQTLFIFLSKNPYAWLLSLHRHPYHYRGQITDFDIFVRSEWPTLGRENHPQPFPNPIVMWNQKNASYLRLARDLPVSLILRYEDLVTEPEEAIRTIAEALEIPLKTSAFINIQASVKGEVGKNFDYYRTYYLEKRWREQFNDDSIRFVNQHLDQDVLHALGYHIESAPATLS